MGRRAKKTKVIKKARPKVDSVFKCPYCNHPDAVECRLEQKRGVGTLECRICGASHSRPINYLSQAIDVFCEWLDECERLNKEQARGVSSNSSSGGGGSSSSSKPDARTEVSAKDLADDEDSDDEDLLGRGYGQRGLGGAEKKKAEEPEEEEEEKEEEEVGSDDEDDEDEDDDDDDDEDEKKAAKKPKRIAEPAEGGTADKKRKIAGLGLSSSDEDSD